MKPCFKLIRHGSGEILDMSKIVWELDKTFRDDVENVIRVLQRPLHDLTNAKGEDLSPFFNEILLFQLRAAKNINPIATVKGILLDFMVDGNAVILEIMPVDGKEKIKWTIQDLKSTLLSVWRVNDFLDAIQVTLNSEHKKIYMQVGGASLSEIFIRGKSGDSQNGEIEKAVEIFNHNVYV